MSFENAKQLHNDDEIRIKETGEHVKVIAVEHRRENIYIDVMAQDGYKILHHSEVE